MYARPTPCRLCQCPALDTNVLMSKLDLGKLAEWWQQLLDTQFEEKRPEDHSICQFCLWDAKYEGEDEEDRAGCDWWTGHDTNQFYRKFYFERDMIRPCEVPIVPIIVPIEKTQADEPPAKSPYCKSTRGVATICVFCRVTLKSKAQAMHHVQTVHRHVPKFLCASCSLFFKSDSQRKKHVKEAHSGGFRCLYCSKFYTNKASLRQHVGHDHLDISIKCHGCVRYFATQTEMDVHAQAKHAKAEYENCFYCKKSIPVPHRARHMRDSHKGEVIRCPYRMCVQFFMTEGERQKHLREAHKREAPQFKQCCLCHMMIHRNHLANHIRVQHANEKYFRCKFHYHCGKYFRVEEDLKHHQKRDHSRSENKLN